MYIDKNIGELIRALRVEKGISQDALCRDFCSAQSISRIENASQNPSVKLFRKLLEQLGDSGFFYGFYFERENLKGLDVKCHILECFEMRKAVEFESTMREYEVYVDKSDKSTLQFMKFAEYLYYDLVSTEPVVSSKQYISLINITHPKFDISKDLDRYLYDYNEFLILNNAVVSAVNEGNMIFGERILKKLLKSVYGSRHFLPSFWKKKAGLFNNLAVCEMEKGNLQGARKAITKANNYLHMDVGILFILKVLKNSMYIYGDEDEMKINLEYRIKALYGMLPKRLKNDMKLSYFLKGREALRVF